METSTKFYRDGKVIVLRKSCLTGKVVWLYRAPSQEAIWKAYSRACQAELERRSQYDEMQERRKANVLQLLAECTSAAGEMTPEKKSLARQLRALSKEMPPFQSEFYDHVVEERKRREEDRLIRQQMREREARRRAEIEKNTNYDK